eukprot:6348386-Amphidinium_carterae.1
MRAPGNRCSPKASHARTRAPQMQSTAGSRLPTCHSQNLSHKATRDLPQATTFRRNQQGSARLFLDREPSNHVLVHDLVVKLFEWRSNCKDVCRRAHFCPSLIEWSRNMSKNQQH